MRSLIYHILIHVMLHKYAQLHHVHYRHLQRSRQNDGYCRLWEIFSMENRRHILGAGHRIHDPVKIPTTCFVDHQNNLLKCHGMETPPPHRS